MVAVSISGCAVGAGAELVVAESPPPPPQPTNKANPISAIMFLVMCPPWWAGVGRIEKGIGASQGRPIIGGMRNKPQGGARGNGLIS